MTSTPDPTQELRDLLVRRKSATEEVQIRAEIDALPRDQVEANIAQLQSVLKDMLPATMKPETSVKLIQRTIQLIRKNPKLAQCGDSLMGGVMTSAQLGLELGVDALGEAYLIPMWNKKKIVVNPRTGREQEGGFDATLIIGYKGYRKLVWQSAMVSEISREIVYTNDHFKRKMGTQRHLEHWPPEDEDDRGEVRGFYATVVNRLGGIMWDYMTLKEAEQFRDDYAMARYQGRVIGPWRDNFKEMALKTILKKVLLESPMSIEDRLMLAAHVDGSVRYNTSEISDPAALLEISEQMTGGVFQGASENVMEGETVDVDPETGEIPDEAPLPLSAEEEQYNTDVRFILEWAERNGENPLDAISSSLGITKDRAQDYTWEEVGKAAAALRAQDEKATAEN